MSFSANDQDNTDESAYAPSWNWDSTQEAGGDRVVNYYFPVEIIVASGLAPRDREIIQAQIYQDLHDAIVDKLA